MPDALGDFAVQNRPVGMLALRAVALRICRLDDDRDVDLGKASDILAPNELARAEHFVHTRHRNRYIRGRAFLRQTLGREMQMPPESLTLSQQRNGKPQVAGQPHGPVPDFNMSHSDGVAVVAVSWQGSVGVDIEMCDRRFDPLALLSTVLQPHEADAISNLTVDDATALFLRFWTAKEARMKLTGEGMWLDPKSIALTLRDGSPVGILAPQIPQVALQFPDLGVPGVVCALVTCAKAGKPEMH